MKLLKELIKIDRKAVVPIYIQIANAIIINIRNGRLRTGLKLPGSRRAAHLIEVNRMTMVTVYDELHAQGWIEKRSRQGTYISNELPVLHPKPLKAEKERIFTMPMKAAYQTDNANNSIFHPPTTLTMPKLIINDGFPDPRMAPMEELTRCMRGLSGINAYKGYWLYGSEQGNHLLRETLTPYLNDTRGLPIDPKHLLITRGATMGIYLAANVLTEVGDDIIVGNPSYIGANELFELLRLKINTVPVDDYGMDIDTIERICKRKKIKFVYSIPHHHHPTTVTLIPERRIRLLDLALKYGFAIIEDDYDYDFHYTSKPLMPMASLDQHGSVIYIGTLTKTLAPAIRIGFMVASEEFIRHAYYIRKHIDFQGDTLLEMAIAELYREGFITRHIKKSVKLYKERRDHFCELLKSQLGDKVTFKIPDGGMSVWTQFNGVDLKKLSEKAGKKGLGISDGTKYNSPDKSQNHNAIRMGFAGLNKAEQEEAMAILKSCI